MTWADLESGGGEALLRLQQDGPLGLGPVDETLVNPQGFLRTTHDPVSLLEPTTDGSDLLLVATPGRDVKIRATGGVGDEAVGRLRSLTGVHVPWRGRRRPAGLRPGGRRPGAGRGPAHRDPLPALGHGRCSTRPSSRP